MMRIFYSIVFCCVLWNSALAYDENVSKIRYGLDIAGSLNMIAVGYQDFIGMGLNSNYDKEGNSEVSGIKNFIGIHALYSSDSFKGLFRLSLDDRSGTIHDENTPNAPIMMPLIQYATLDASYVTQPFQSFSLYAGPSLSVLLTHSLGSINSQQTSQPIPTMNPITFGFQLGCSYDGISFPLEHANTTISPFFETSWMANQRKGEFSNNQDGWDNIWSTFSWRFGLRTSFDLFNHDVIKIDTDTLGYILNVPTSIAGRRSVIEYVPIIPTIFFDSNSTEIPKRYEIITAKEAPLFSEYQIDYTLESNDSQKQMEKRLHVYYECLNIIGHRLMHSNDSITIIGHGSSNEEGLLLVQAIREYLMNVFHIESYRLQYSNENNIQSRYDTLPASDMYQQYMIKQQNRFVQIIASDLLLKPVRLTFSTVDPPENMMYCTVLSPPIINNWSINISGPGSIVKEYGPFTKRTAFFSATELLGGESVNKEYTAQVIATDTDGRIIKKTSLFALSISESDKMHAIAYTIPNSEFSDSTTLRTRIVQTIVPSMKNNNEIILIGGHNPIGQSILNKQKVQNTIELFQSIVLDECNKAHISIKNIQQINMGIDNYCTKYPLDLPEGRTYNDALRIEIVR